MSQVKINKGEKLLGVIEMPTHKHKKVVLMHPMYQVRQHRLKMTRLYNEFEKKIMLSCIAAVDGIDSNDKSMLPCEQLEKISLTVATLRETMNRPVSPAGIEKLKALTDRFDEKLKKRMLIPAVDE